MGKKTRQLVTGPEAEQATRCVTGEAQKICDASSVWMPKIRIVNALSGPTDDLTAEVHFPLRGRPIINVPLRVVQEYPRKAFVYLVTHEVGHVARKSQRLRLCKAALLALMILVIVASAFTGFSGAYSELILSEPSAWPAPAASALLLSSLVPLAGILAIMRREERDADRFAAEYLGDIEGAEECFRFTESHRKPAKKPGWLTRWLRRLLATHPPNASRVQAMRTALQR